MCTSHCMISANMSLFCSNILLSSCQAASVFIMQSTWTCSTIVSWVDDALHCTAVTSSVVNCSWLSHQMGAAMWSTNWKYSQFWTPLHYSVSCIAETENTLLLSLISTAGWFDHACAAPVALHGNMEEASESSQPNMMLMQLTPLKIACCLWADCILRLGQHVLASWRISHHTAHGSTEPLLRVHRWLCTTDFCETSDQGTGRLADSPQNTRMKNSSVSADTWCHLLCHAAPAGW